MPRANDKRKPVGTEHCNDCGTLARFYQVQRGHRTGYLYRRCECGADQSTGAAKQVRWLNSMDKTAEPMIPHPLEAARGTQEATQAEPQEPEPVKQPEPQAPQGVNPQPSNKKSGLIGVAALVGAVLVGVLT